MLASNRTRIVQRGYAQEAAFDPAEILVDTYAPPPVACVMGAFRKLARDLIEGGFLANHQLAFRVLRSAFTSPIVEGMTLQWRVPGEVTYRGVLRIETIVDRASVPYLLLGCVNPNK